MHPIERLRWIARTDDEPATTIAGEAAWTLGELGSEDPAAVLTASRRLVERQPTCGPLWWVCAHLVASADPFETARRLSAELYSDPVPDRLADSLAASFTSSDLLAATSPVDVLQQALHRRGRYRLRLLAGARALRRDLHLVGSVADEVTGFEPGEVDEALEGASVLLVEPELASPEGLLVEEALGQVIEVAHHRHVPVWALLGTGRVLPLTLATRARELAGDRVRLLAPRLVAVAVDETGAGDVARALASSSCPPGAELTRGAA